MLAKRLDIWIPDGHTFVRESEGKEYDKARIRYRNTALNGVFYYDSKELSEGKIDQLGPLVLKNILENILKRWVMKLKVVKVTMEGLTLEP